MLPKQKKNEPFDLDEQCVLEKSRDYSLHVINWRFCGFPFSDSVLAVFDQYVRVIYCDVDMREQFHFGFLLLTFFFPAFRVFFVFSCFSGFILLFAVCW